MDHLTILSLGRNLIKKIENLDGVADTLEELWISYNLIDKLTNIEKLTKLRILYMSNNKVSCVRMLYWNDKSVHMSTEQWCSPLALHQYIELSCLPPCTALRLRWSKSNLFLQIASWGEIEKLQALENLEELLLVGNPIFEASGSEQTKLKSEWRIEVGLEIFFSRILVIYLLHIKSRF